MKAGIYNALASLNQGFDAAIQALKVMQDEGVLTIDYIQDQTVLAQELRAGLNYMIVEKLNARETEDRDHYAKMRMAIETRLRSS